MATISRPGKEGGATTYQGKVAAGYLNILAQEVDADIDAIYSAWNAGVDTVNIKDASVTAAKLAPGAVIGTALAPGSVTHAALAANSVDSSNIIDGSITSADIANGTILDADIANVAWAKLIAPFINTLTLATRGRVDASSTQVIDLLANNPSDQAYDGSKPSWIVRLDYTGDQFVVLRAPPPGTAFVALLYLTGAGRLFCNLADNSVARSQLGVNAANGAAVTAYSPVGFSLGTAAVWTTFVTLPALTTRGGMVHIHANHTLSGYGPPGGAICQQRLLRDGAAICTRSFNIASPSSQTVAPWPHMSWIDTGVPAGSHTYVHQIQLGSGAVVTSSNIAADGYYIAMEVG